LHTAPDTAPTFLPLPSEAFFPGKLLGDDHPQPSQGSEAPLSSAKLQFKQLYESCLRLRKSRTVASVSGIAAAQRY